MKKTGDGGGLIDTTGGRADEISPEEEMEKQIEEQRQAEGGGGENFFRPIEEGEEGGGGNGPGEKRMSKSVSLPAINGASGKSPNQETAGNPSPSPTNKGRSATFRRAMNRRTMRATQSGKIVEAGSSPTRRETLATKRVGSADAKKKRKALKEKIHGLVHVALTEQPDERTPVQLDLLVAESRLMPAFAHLDAAELRVLWKYVPARVCERSDRVSEAIA